MEPKKNSDRGWVDKMISIITPLALGYMIFQIQTLQSDIKAIESRTLTHIVSDTLIQHYTNKRLEDIEKYIEKENNKKEEKQDHVNLLKHEAILPERIKYEQEQETNTV